ncbi:ATP-dependent DNA helicase [Trichonephila clavipes]|nr:ATP-dependent DNA helicase [Trichonephila clavipes]
MTLSAAENRWFDLIKHLVYIPENRILTESEFETMSSTAKKKLISNDPVTCALYFEHKVKELWKTFSCTEGPFGKLEIKHFYHRTEFQQRGSPHFHVLLWLEGFPRFDGNNAPEVEAFINILITCSIEHSFSVLQRHKHTFTCLKKTRRQDNEYCRFSIPFFPTDRTRILLPLILEHEQRDSEKFKRVRELLTQLEQKDVSMRGTTFKEFLEHLNMSYEEYLLALRSGINRSTVVLKRTVNEFVLDEYAVVAYLVDYVNKPGRGLSKILRNCIEATAKGKHKECFFPGMEV